MRNKLILQSRGQSVDNEFLSKLAKHTHPLGLTEDNLCSISAFWFPTVLGFGNICTNLSTFCSWLCQYIMPLQWHRKNTLQLLDILKLPALILSLPIIADAKFMNTFSVTKFNKLISLCPTFWFAFDQFWDTEDDDIELSEGKFMKSCLCGDNNHHLHF